ncbi:fumarylacetoacetate hydrolase family protein [Alteribacillus sp. YIM 98480]|uniref:fumarylacetoacetate hydrolase family protein n=1 Tax=Alteribacillus sp. YIM 98480 TaxID=2606599 RepID=UPI00131EC2DF|nr:fumarylacetoacetate hydrolase family protein [Alteribacillus sp. YIM 98480]
MKLSTVLINNESRLVGFLNETHVIDLFEAQKELNNKEIPENVWMNMQSFIEAGEPAILACQQMLSDFTDSLSHSFIYPFEDLKVLPPIPRPLKNIMCVGRNYKEHVGESKQLSGKSQPIPEKPIYFTKSFTSLVAHEDFIEFNRNVTEKVDYEGELAVIIGSKGKNISKNKAMDYVFGYSIMNDVSARDLQFGHVQYFKGKALDTFAPIGPCIVHKSSLPDYTKFKLQTTVNGELRQSASLEQLIFDIPTIISTLSSGMTLHPGDIIATGTPSGVGGGFDPQRFLNDGDIVEITVDPIGTLRNSVREL